MCLVLCPVFDVYEAAQRYWYHCEASKNNDDRVTEILANCVQFSVLFAKIKKVFVALCVDIITRKHSFRMHTAHLLTID